MAAPPASGAATVRLVRAQVSEPGLGRYLGLDELGAPLYGRRVTATVEIALFVPMADGPAALEPLYEAALWALSESTALAEDGLEVGQAQYDDACRALRQPLTAHLSGLLLATQQEDGGMITEFILKGTMT